MSCGSFLVRYNFHRGADGKCNIFTRHSCKCIADRSNEWEEICNSIHYFLAYPLIYCSTALLMNVLLGTSPRVLSTCFTSVIGSVIPHFCVLPTMVVPIILVLRITDLINIPVCLSQLAEYSVWLMWWVPPLEGYAPTTSVLMNFWKAGLNQPSGSICFHISPIVPLRKQFLIHCNQPAHSLSSSTFLWRIANAWAHIHRI